VPLGWTNGGGPALNATNLAKLLVVDDVGTPGTPTGDALRAAYVPKWKPSTAYASGEFVLNPSGQIVSANATFTSGATYSAANWTVTSGGGGGTVSDATSSAKGIMQLAGDLAGTAAAPTVAKIGGVSILLSDTRPGSPATGLVRIGLAASGDTTAPSTPTGLTVTPGNTQNALTWTASTDNVAVTGYKVRRGGTVVGTPSGTSYTDTGLTNGTTYSYTVSAVDAAANESAQTSAVTGTPSAGADSTPPTAPTSLAAGTPTSTTIPLTWTASTDNVGVVAYDVYNSGSLLQSGLTGTSGTVTGLTASTAYVLTLKARDAAGNASTASNSVSVSTAAGAGTNPTTVAGLSSLWTVDSLSSTDGTEIDSFPSTGGAGTNNTMIQGAGTGPVYHTAVQNGLPVLRGDGTRTMFTSGTLTPAMGTTNTVFLVGRFITFAQNKTLIDGDNTNSYRLYANSGTQVQMFTGGGGTASYTLPNPTSWHVFAIRRTGTATNSLQLWVDGTMVAQGTPTTTTTFTQLRIFGDSTAPANADMGEMVAYHATALSDADMLGVSRFLGSKWGVTTA
jgi:chitodextrinase